MFNDELKYYFNMNETYSVYKHITPNNMVYYGISNDVNKRWKNYGECYINTSLYKYILKYGWDNIQHIVLFQDLTEKDARIIEGQLIDDERKKGDMCINSRRSGLVTYKNGKPPKKKTYKGINPIFNKIIEEENLDTNVSSQTLRSKCENILYKQSIIDFMDSCDGNTLNTLENVVEALKTYENSELCEMLGKKIRVSTVCPFKNITVKRLNSILKHTRYSTISTEKDKDVKIVEAFIDKYPNLSSRKLYDKIKDYISMSFTTFYRFVKQKQTEKELTTYSKQKSAYIAVDEVDQTTIVNEEETVYTKTQKRKISQHQKLYTTI